MIVVSGIGKKYGNKRALSEVSFTAQKGEILGLLGRNGAGKSTTMNIMTGCISSDEGSVSINGFDIMEQPIDAKRSIGYLPEHPPVYPEMTVNDYLKFVCRLKGMSKKETPAFISEILGMINIEDVRNRLIGNLSKGYRQRVGLAQALCGKPETIILDEPTVGLDPLQIIEIRQIIKSLGEEHTVILSSHILREITDICTHVAIINEGKLLLHDSMEHLLESSAKNITKVRLRQGAEDIQTLIKSIDGVAGVYETQIGEEGYRDFDVVSAGGADVREAIFQKISDSGAALVMMKPAQQTLEAVFTELISNEESRVI